MKNGTGPSSWAAIITRRVFPVGSPVARRAPTYGSLQPARRLRAEMHVSGRVLVVTHIGRPDPDGFLMGVEVHGQQLLCTPRDVHVPSEAHRLAATERDPTADIRWQLRTSHGEDHLLAAVITPGILAIVYSVVLGAMGGGVRTVAATLLPKWFGTGHIGSIQGLLTFFGVAASAIGPVALAVAENGFGSYPPALVSLSILPLAALVFSLGRDRKILTNP